MTMTMNWRLPPLDDARAHAHASAHANRNRNRNCLLPVCHCLVPSLTKPTQTPLSSVVPFGLSLSLRPCLILHSPFSHTTHPHLYPQPTTHQSGIIPSPSLLLLTTSLQQPASYHHQPQIALIPILSLIAPHFEKHKEQLHHGHIPRIDALHHRQWRTTH